jgi:ABC-type molybdate transport system ATPase subunit
MSETLRLSSSARSKGRLWQKVSATAEIQFDEVVDLLGLEGLLDRAPRRLSGGER